VPLSASLPQFVCSPLALERLSLLPDGRLRDTDTIEAAASLGEIPKSAGATAI